MVTTAIARIDFGNVEIKLHVPAFGQNTDDDDDDSNLGTADTIIHEVQSEDSVVLGEYCGCLCPIGAAGQHCESSMLILE